MGTSVEAEISFGVFIDEGHGLDLPWEQDSCECDIDFWWEQTNNKPENPNKYPFDKNSVDKNEYEKWKNWETNWEIKHPMPFQKCYIYSYEYGGYILAAKSSVFGSCGSVDEFNKDGLKVLDSEVEALKKVCKEYGIEGELRWYLTAYMG